MGSLNKVILLGNVGKDAELNGDGDHAMLRFSVATSRKWKGHDGQPKEETTWHNCVLWGKRGIAVQKYIVKGSQVAVTGMIRHSKYMKDGVERTSTDIVVEDIQLCGGNGKPSQPKPQQQHQSHPQTIDGYMSYAPTDDIPF